MKLRQAFRFELMPTGEQRRLMRRFAGSCRFVFNRALALQQECYRQGESHLSYAGLCKLLTEWRHSPETGWLAEAPVHALQQALKDLGRAYANFFGKRAEFPRFRKKGRRERFRYPDPKQIKLDQRGSRIFLPKLGWLRYRNSREVVGELRNVTVSASGEKWFVSVQTERDVEPAVHPSRSIVGVDVGVARFATLCDGTVFEPSRSFRRHERRLARAQRRMARKVKFSNNWKKDRARVQKIHRKIANVRRDHLHKTTSTISQNHAVVCIEDLRVQNMSRSARGTRERPGRNVKAKAGLNRAILDQGWYEFRRQLEYKQEWRGGRVVLVPAQHTSQRCVICGHTAAENRRTQPRFQCVRCGFAAHADRVAAINIRRAGHARIACGERAQEGRSMKQEPTEATAHEVLCA
ncbi:MAG TPA: transposase [Candidatus Krumholzibacteria bacterium]